MMDDFQAKAREKFAELVKQFDENVERMLELQKQLDHCRQLDSMLNDRLCVLGELLGIDDLDLAGRYVREAGYNLPGKAG